jgi:hypothetical protein
VGRAPYLRATDAPLASRNPGPSARLEESGLDARGFGAGFRSGARSSSLGSGPEGLGPAGRAPFLRATDAPLASRNPGPSARLEESGLDALEFGAGFAFGWPGLFSRVRARGARSRGKGSLSRGPAPFVASPESGPLAVLGPAQHLGVYRHGWICRWCRRHLCLGWGRKGSVRWEAAPSFGSRVTLEVVRAREGRQSWGAHTNMAETILARNRTLARQRSAGSS